MPAAMAAAIPISSGESIQTMNRILILAAILLILPHTARADLDLPVTGVVTSGVGWRPDPFGSGKFTFHRGTDIAVPVGTPVHATRGGRVAFAGVHGGHGSTVIVEHDNGDRTLYGHNSALTVQRGERVEAGATIALSGNSGRSTGPHVHYEVQRSGRFFADVAQLEVTAELRNSPDRILRNRQEQKIEDAVNSILQKIKSSSTVSGNAAQEG